MAPPQQRPAFHELSIPAGDATAIPWAAAVAAIWVKVAWSAGVCVQPWKLRMSGSGVAPSWAGGTNRSYDRDVPPCSIASSVWRPGSTVAAPQADDGSAEDGVPPVSSLEPDSDPRAGRVLFAHVRGR